MPIAFYATDYYANKNRYVLGAELDIELAASGYKVVEGEEKTVLDAETSARMRSDMGIEPEYDEDGEEIELELKEYHTISYDNAEYYYDFESEYDFCD